jgi:hypothetical protein
VKNILLILFLLSSAALGAQETATWQQVVVNKEAIPRHENAMVECNGKFYALGGRGIKPIEEYNPKTRTWKALAESPVEFHHLQAIAFKNEVYVIGALTGKYPHETPLPNFLIFNPAKNAWR